MKRRVQLWRFYDSDDQPSPPLPARPLHRFLLAQDRANADMSYTDPHGFETHLVPVDSTRPHFVIHRIRDHDLPSQRSGGRITDLDRRVQELAEGSHLLLLQRNLLAFLGTGFSPRPGRFAEWLRHRLDWDVWLEPVLRPEVGTVLDEIRKITRVEIKVAADEARRLDASGFFEGDDDPLGALYTAQQAQHGGIIGLEMSVGQGSGADQGFFRSLIERMRRADLSGFRTARAHVHLADNSDGSTIVDFLHDKVVAEIEVDQARGRQRLLDNPTARQVMESAWEQFQETDDVLNYVDQPEGEELDVPDRLVDNALT